jgi:hypothetical protein
VEILEAQMTPLQKALKEKAVLERALKLAAEHMHHFFVGHGFRPHTTRKIINHFMRKAKTNKEKK